MDKTEVTAEDIQKLLDEGKTKEEICEELEISTRKYSGLLNAAKKKEEHEEIPPAVFAKTFADGNLTESSKVVIMTADEYEEYSKANGRVMGRPKGKKTKCTIEELRALINSGWKPSRIMGKHGMNEGEFKQLVWQLSKRELRDRPLKFSLDQDFIERG